MIDHWTDEQMDRWARCIDRHATFEQSIHLNAPAQRIEGIVVDVRAVTYEGQPGVQIGFADRPQALVITPGDPWRLVGIRSMHWQTYQTHQPTRLGEKGHTDRDQTQDHRQGADSSGPHVASVTVLRPVTPGSPDTGEEDHAVPSDTD